MTYVARTLAAGLVVLAGLGAGPVGTGAAAPSRAGQDAAALQQPEAPPNGIWVDSLDLSDAPIRRPRRRRARGGEPQPEPPPIKAMLGGVEYPHGLPIAASRVNEDIAIDLKAGATSFAAMVGIHDGAQAGSVVFALWVDGREVVESDVLRAGDDPVLLTADLTGASSSWRRSTAATAPAATTPTGAGR